MITAPGEKGIEVAGEDEVDGAGQQGADFDGVDNELRADLEDAESEADVQAAVTGALQRRIVQKLMRTLSAQIEDARTVARREAKTHLDGAFAVLRPRINRYIQKNTPEYVRAMERLMALARRYLGPYSFQSENITDPFPVLQGKPLVPEFLKMMERAKKLQTDFLACRLLFGGKVSLPDGMVLPNAPDTMSFSDAFHMIIGMLEAEEFLQKPALRALADLLARDGHTGTSIQRFQPHEIPGLEQWGAERAGFGKGRKPKMDVPKVRRYILDRAAGAEGFLRSDPALEKFSGYSPGALSRIVAGLLEEGALEGYKVGRQSRYRLADRTGACWKSC